jgi:hypothetical protein
MRREREREGGKGGREGGKREREREPSSSAVINPGGATTLIR